MMLSQLSPIIFRDQTSLLLKVLTVGLLLTVASFYMPISHKASNNIFYGLVLIPFIVSLFTPERLNYSFGALSPYFFFLVITMGVFALPDAPIKSVKYTIYLLCFWVVISSLVAKDIIDTNKLALWLMILSVLFCLNILFIHFIIDGEPLSSRPNLWATWRSGSPIDASMLLVCFMVTGIGALPRRLLPPIGLFVILVALIIQSLLQTRSGIAGMLAAGLYMVFFWMVNSRKLHKGLLFGLTALFAGIMILYQFDFFDILVERGGSYRLELYQLTAKEYLNCNLLMGCGYNYEFQSTLSGDYHIAHPHSIYSSLLLYLGPLSLIGLITLLAKAFFEDLRAHTPWIYGVTAASAFFLLDGSKILDNPNLIWICLIFPLAIIDGLSQQKKIT